VAKGGHPGVETETIDKDFLDVFRLDCLEVAVERSFCDNDDRLSLTDRSVLWGASASS
jgi:hypothetical protein